jgi:hypothetical protein
MTTFTIDSDNNITASVASDQAEGRYRCRCAGVWQLGGADAVGRRLAR